jgi:hypothetical protein
VAIAFSPGGYTSARLAPVKNRIGSALAGPWQNGSAAFTPAAKHAPTNINRRGCTKSAKFVSAEIKHPKTNPSCTEIVIQAPKLGDKCHSARNWGSTADAENHAPMLSTHADASAASARHLPGGSISVCIPEFILCAQSAMGPVRIALSCCQI